MSERPETGVMQFGDDWPGVFIRGDNASHFAFSLTQVMDGPLKDLIKEKPINYAFLIGLQRLLASSDVREGQKPQFAALAASPEQHPDDAAVDLFAQRMKEKMKRSREKGRDGWDDPELCSNEFLADLFAGHLEKENEGNIVDLACLLMMLAHRGASEKELTSAVRERFAVSEDLALDV